jgi:hypothetical protein
MITLRKMKFFYVSSIDFIDFRKSVYIIKEIVGELNKYNGGIKHGDEELIDPVGENRRSVDQACPAGRGDDRRQRCER